ncbi:MAG: selenide, water dikinase [Solirubrobacteraceae bacterium]|jgi:selenide,water dikinase|nr:selenide, water dikinase [Solirubrobacteraceae bacterium]
MAAPTDDTAPARAVRLTELSPGAGCGCKLGAADLAEVLSGLDGSLPAEVLVGPATADDAGVFRISDDLALVHTVDFFTPIVDDPYDFGRIAATNALSDVYAMGGRPLSALNLVAFSVEDLGADVLREILRGGADAARAAGAAIVGGHSIEDREPKYGLAVTGAVHPDRILTNAGARPGDALVLTKPLGAGAISTAAKRGAAGPADVAAAVAVMTELNAAAAEAALAAGAHAATDVTGFGLLGHLHELAVASGVSAEVSAGAIPAIGRARDLLAGEEAVSGGLRRNLAHASSFTTFDDAVAEVDRRLAADPMTSGGLLVALPPDRAALVPGAVIGAVEPGAAGALRVGP